MSLTVVISPMFSGKTTFLINRIVGLTKLGFKTIFVNHTLDNRNTKGSISCHNKVLENGIESSTFDIIQINDLSILNMLNNPITDDKDYYFIDEFQFFQQDDAVSQVMNLVNNKKHVYVAGLKGDYRNNIFGHTLELIPHADHIIVLKSICVDCAKNGKCTEASFTKYNSQGERDQIAVGADELYTPVCREHHNI
jgi:thymidine kinase